MLNKHLLENLTYPAIEHYRNESKKLVGRSLNCKREIVEEILAHGERFLISAKQAKTDDQVISNHSAELSDAEKNSVIKEMPDAGICAFATTVTADVVTWSTDNESVIFKDEAQRREIDCGVRSRANDYPSSAFENAPMLPTVKFADTKLPAITIASATTKGAQGIIRGRVSDNTGIAELRVDGQKIAVDSNGNFSATTYVPEGGTSVNIEAIDLAGLSSTMSVRVNRATTQTASFSFDKLNPLNRKALPNKDAVALIIGIGSYENIIDAAYADKDALVFRDYATEARHPKQSD